MAMFLSLEILRQIAGGEAALLVVAAAGAERVPHAAIGELRIGRGRRDLQHAAVEIGVGGRDRRRGAIMADHTATSCRTSFSATDRACLGSQASSPTSSLSLRPSTPPAALMSAMACSAPFFICRPKVAWPPVIGPATATVMSCAMAGAAKRPKRNARAQSRSLFMSDPLEVRSSSGASRIRRNYHCRGKSSRPTLRHCKGPARV